MEDKASKKITELAFEAATRHENTHTQKRKEILKVEEITIAPEQEIEPEDL